MTKYSRTCPYCKESGIIDSDINRIIESFEYRAPGSHGLDYGKPRDHEQLHRATVLIEICPNPACRNHTMKIHIDAVDSYNQDSTDILSRTVIPWGGEADIVSLPDCGVPSGINEDYVEAQKIKTLSPKAACTLARRAMQGMIRDFHGIKEKNLFFEIDALKDVIEDGLYQALDSVRKVGNVGAHMEKDIGVIVDVDEGEADALIEMVDLLCTDWYVARAQRQQRIERAQQAAESIAGKKKDVPKPDP